MTGFFTVIVLALAGFGFMNAAERGAEEKNLAREHGYSIITLMLAIAAIAVAVASYI